MFQLELVGKPVIKWLVIRVIETLHINGGSCSPFSNGHFQPRILPSGSITNVQDGNGREQAGQKGVGSEAPPPYCAPPTWIASLRGEVQRSTIPPFIFTPPETGVIVQAGGHILQSALSFSRHRWT